MNQDLTPPGPRLDGDPKQAPEQWVARFAGLVRPKGAVVDLACGSGRHGRLFLDRGNPVVLVDRDVAGVQDLAGRPGVEIVAADLENGTWPFGLRRFACVVGVNYLHRPSFPVILDALAPGGVLIWQTFAAGNERFGRPSNPAFLLQPGELLEVVRGRLTVVAYEHGEIAVPRSAVIQRICALAGGAIPGNHCLP